MRRRLRGTETTDVDMTPMLDIVFIMLIFFIVTASFVKEFGLDINQPDTPEVAQPIVQEAILVRIDSHNQVWIDSRLIDLKAARANMERLHAENPDRALVIQPHADANAGIMVSLYDAALLAGITSIAVAKT